MKSQWTSSWPDACMASATLVAHFNNSSLFIFQSHNLRFLAHLINDLLRDALISSPSRNRTGTPVKESDFKSEASAYSAKGP